MTFKQAFEEFGQLPEDTRKRELAATSMGILLITLPLLLYLTLVDAPLVVTSFAYLMTVILLLGGIGLAAFALSRTLVRSPYCRYHLVFMVVLDAFLVGALVSPNLLALLNGDHSSAPLKTYSAQVSVNALKPGYVAWLTLNLKVEAPSNGLPQDLRLSTSNHHYTSKFSNFKAGDKVTLLVGEGRLGMPFIADIVLQTKD